MDNRTLFTADLGLQSPWEVARIEFLESGLVVYERPEGP